MIIIGEKINGSIPAVAEAIAKRDADFIKARARAQADAGASFIDCCASVPEAEEVETFHWMIDCIQEVTDLPISVDSPSPQVLAQAYRFCKKPGIFNSVSGEGDKIDTIFPIMAQPENRGWQAIALLSDDTGIPKCAADRLQVFDKIMTKAKLVGAAVQAALDEGCDPMQILNEGMINTMSVVGEKFKNGEIFIPEMLVAARAMKKGVEVLNPIWRPAPPARRARSSSPPWQATCMTSAKIS